MDFRNLVSALSTLALTAALLAGCVTTSEPAESEGRRPDGVSAVVGETARYTLFEGERSVDHRPFVDGRVWRLDRDSGEVVLLTPPERFGEHFFASAVALTPDGRDVLVEVNLEDSPGNLFLIDVESGEERFIADLPTLGLSDLVVQTATMSPDGDTLAFSAWTLERVAGAGEEQHLSRLGVYVLDLDARRPADTLTALHLAAPDAAPRLLYPEFGADDRIVIHRSPPAPPLAPATVALP